MSIAQRVERSDQFLRIGPARWIDIGEGEGNPRVRAHHEHRRHRQAPLGVAVQPGEVAATLAMDADVVGRQLVGQPAGPRIAVGRIAALGDDVRHLGRAAVVGHQREGGVALVFDVTISADRGKDADCDPYWRSFAARVLKLICNRSEARPLSPFACLSA